MGTSVTVPLAVPTQSLMLGQEMGFLRSVEIPTDCIAISSIKLIYRKTGTGNLYLKFAFARSPKAGGTLTEDSDSYTAYAAGTDDVVSVSVPVSAYNGLTSIAVGDTLYLACYRNDTDPLDTYTTDLEVIGFLIDFAVSTTTTSTTTSTPTGQHTTYDDLIGDILANVNEGDKLEGLSPETLQLWILEAEKQICDKIEIRDEYTLGMNTDVSKYNFRNRPVITGATTATPIVVSSTSHGLVVGDRVYVADVMGLTGANGKKYVSAKDTDTFTIKDVVDITDATNATPISITANAHGRTTGDLVTITGVTGNTAANVTNNAITVVDVNTFTLDGVTGNGTYVSGGIGVFNTVGSGTWTSGGRYWKDDEIPTYFKRIFTGTRSWGGVQKEVVAVDNGALREKSRLDSERYALYSDSVAPNVMTEWMSERVPYLEVYPAPQSDHNLTLYGRVKITPRDYVLDPLTANIHLSSDYETAIIAYVENRIYRWIKEYNLAKDAYARYESEINSLRISFPRNIVQRMTYW
jgi:hypothetical protein